MIHGLALALIGLIICPAWHLIHPPTIHVGYLVGLGFVGIGVFVQLAGLLLKIREQRRTGKAQRSIRTALSILVLFSIYLFMELSASAWIMYTGNRASLHEFRLAQRNEKLHHFVPHPFLAYTKNPDLEMVNAYGFNGRNWKINRAPGEIRIACVGGSTTEDGYPEELEKQLITAFPDRPTTIMNFGLSGWTSAHGLVNYILNGRHFKPDFIVIHQGANDYKASWWDDVRTDYSHAFRSLGKPARPPDHLLVRYMNSYAVLKWKYFEWREWSAGPDLDQLMMQDLDPDRHVSGESLRVTDIFSGNIRALVRFALDDGASVVMMTQPYSRTNPDWGNNFIPHMERINAEIIACSADYKVPLIDLDSELNGREESFRDPLHLVQDAVAVKAGRVANLISQLILESGK